MDTVIAFKAINQADAQSLSAAQKTDYVASCRAFIQHVEVAELLKDALNMEQPEFRNFSRIPLKRLKDVIEAVPGSDELRIASLDEMEPVSLIVLGLCVSPKRIRRMSSEAWTELLRQTEQVATRIRSFILDNDDIGRVIQQCNNEEFRQNFNRELELRTETSHDMFMNGNPCYHYKITHAFQFRKLVDLAINRVVSVYLPMFTSDCRLRLATPFDKDLLKTLFRFAPEKYVIDSFTIVAVVGQIMPVLGEDVFLAVRASNLWRASPIEGTTPCVKGIVYPGHLIMIEIVAEYQAGVSFVNSVFACP